MSFCIVVRSTGSATSSPRARVRKISINSRFLTIVREVVQINIQSGATSAGSSLSIQVSHRLPLDVVHKFDQLDELEDLVSEEFEVVSIRVGVSTDLGEGATQISSNDRAKVVIKVEEVGHAGLRDVGLGTTTVHKWEGTDVRERSLIILVVHRPPVAVVVVPADNISRLDINVNDRFNPRYSTDELNYL